MDFDYTLFILNRMKTSGRYFLYSLLFFMFLSCTEEHFLKDEAYRNQVQADFAMKQLQLPYGDLFGVFRDSTLTAVEREALMFLYAYMPIGDITDYSGDYYLENIRLTEQAP